MANIFDKITAYFQPSGQQALKASAETPMSKPVAQPAPAQTNYPSPKAAAVAQAFQQKQTSPAPVQTNYPSPKAAAVAQAFQQKQTTPQTYPSPKSKTSAQSFQYYQPTGTLSSRSAAADRANGVDWSNASEEQKRYNSVFYRTIDDPEYTRLYTSLESLLDQGEDVDNKAFTEHYQEGLAALSKKREDLLKQYTRGSYEVQALDKAIEKYKELGSDTAGRVATAQAQAYSDQLDEQITTLFSGVVNSPDYQTKAAEGRAALEKKGWSKRNLGGASEAQLDFLGYVYTTDGGMDAVKDMYHRYFGDVINYSRAAQDFASDVSNDDKFMRFWEANKANLGAALIGQDVQGYQQTFTDTKADPNDRTLVGDYTISDSVDDYLKQALAGSVSDEEIARYGAEGLRRIQEAGYSAEWFLDAMANGSEYQKNLLGYLALAQTSEEELASTWQDIKDRDAAIWQTVKGSQSIATKASALEGQMYFDYYGLDNSEMAPSWLGTPGDDEMTAAQAIWNHALNIRAQYPQRAANIAGALIGGPALGPAMARILGGAVMATSVYGNAYKQAVDEGKDPKQAVGYAATQAISEEAVELLTGGLGAVPGILTSGASEALIKNIADPFVRAAIDYGVRSMGEGLQEAIQEIAEPLFRNIWFDESNKIEAWNPQIQYAFFTGVFSAAAGGADTFVQSAITNTRLAHFGKALNTTGASQKLVDMVRNNPVEGITKEQKEAAKASLELAEAISSGKVKATDLNIGKLEQDYKAAGGDLSFLTNPSTATYTKEQITLEDMTAGATSWLVEYKGDASLAPDIAKLAMGQQISEEAQTKINESPLAQEIVNQLKGELDMSQNNALTLAARASTVRGGAEVKTYTTLQQNNPNNTVLTPVARQLVNEGAPLEKAQQISGIISKVQEGVKPSKSEIKLLGKYIRKNGASVRGILLDKLDLDFSEFATDEWIASRLNERANEVAGIKQDQAAVKQGAKAAAQARGEYSNEQLRTALQRAAQAGDAEAAAAIALKLQQQVGKAKQTIEQRKENAKKARAKGQEQKPIPENQWTPAMRAIARSASADGFKRVVFLSEGFSAIDLDENGSWVLYLRMNGTFETEQYQDHETTHLWLKALSKEDYRNLLLTFYERIGGAQNESNTDAQTGEGRETSGETGYSGSTGEAQSDVSRGTGGDGQEGAFDTERGVRGGVSPADEALEQVLLFYQEDWADFDEDTQFLKALEEIFCYARGKQNFADKNQTVITTDFSQWKEIADQIVDEYNLDAMGTGDLSNPAVAQAVAEGNYNQEYFEQQGYLAEDEMTPSPEITTETPAAEQSPAEQTTETVRGKATEEEKAARIKRSFESSRRQLESASDDRRAYLAQKRQEFADRLRGLKTDDLVYLDDEDNPAFKVLFAGEEGMSVAFFDEDGEIINIERILPETFTGDNMISLLETSENFVVNKHAEEATEQFEAATEQSEEAQKEKPELSRYEAAARLHTLEGMLSTLRQERKRLKNKETRAAKRGEEADPALRAQIDDLNEQIEAGKAEQRELKKIAPDESKRNYSYEEETEEINSIGWISPDGETASFTDNINGLHEDLFFERWGEDPENAIGRGFVRVKPGVGIEVDADAELTWDQYDTIEQIIDRFPGKEFLVDYDRYGANMRTVSYTGADIDSGKIVRDMRNVFTQVKASKVQESINNQFVANANVILADYGVTAKTQEDVQKYASFFINQPGLSDVEVEQLRLLMRGNPRNKVAYSYEEEAYAEDFDTSEAIERGKPVGVDPNYHGYTDLLGSPITLDMLNYFGGAQSIDENGNLVFGILPLYLASDTIGFSAYDTMKSDDKVSIFLTNGRGVGASYALGGARKLADMKALGALREYLAEQLGYADADDMPLPSTLFTPDGSPVDPSAAVRMYNAVLKYPGGTPWVSREGLSPIRYTENPKKPKELNLLEADLQYAWRAFNELEENHAAVYFNGFFGLQSAYDDFVNDLRESLFAGFYNEARASIEDFRESIRQAYDEIEEDENTLIDDPNTQETLGVLIELREELIDCLDQAYDVVELAENGNDVYEDMADWRSFVFLDENGEEIPYYEILSTLMASGAWAVYANTRNPLVLDGTIEPAKTPSWAAGLPVGALSGEAKPGRWSSLLHAVQRDPRLYEKFNRWFTQWKKENPRFENVPVMTRVLANFAKAMGYDSLIIKNIYDIGPYGVPAGYETASDIYVVFSPEQIKSVNNKHPTLDKRMNYSYEEENTGDVGEDAILAGQVYQNNFFGENRSADTESYYQSRIDELINEAETANEARQAEIWEEIGQLQSEQFNRTYANDAPEESGRRRTDVTEEFYTREAAQRQRVLDRVAAEQEAKKPKTPVEMAFQPRPSDSDVVRAMAELSETDNPELLALRGELDDLKQEYMSASDSDQEHLADIMERLSDLASRMMQAKAAQEQRAEALAQELEAEDRAEQPVRVKPRPRQNSIPPAPKPQTESVRRRANEEMAASRPVTINPAQSEKPSVEKTVRKDKDTQYTKKTGEYWNRIGEADKIELRRLRSDRNTFDVRFTAKNGEVVTYSEVSPSMLTRAFAYKLGNRVDALARTDQAMALVETPGLEWTEFDNPANEVEPVVKEEAQRGTDNYGRKVPAKLTEYMANSAIRDDQGRLINVYRLALNDGTRNAKRPGQFIFWSEKPSTMNIRRGLRGAEAISIGQRQNRQKVEEWFAKISDPKTKMSELSVIRSQLAKFERENREYTRGVTRLDPFRPGYTTARPEDIVNNKALLEGYLNITNPKVINAMGASLEELTRIVRESLEDPSFENDGFKFINANILPKGTTLGGGSMDRDTVYVTLNNNQGKSTYNTDPTDHAQMQYSLEEDNTGFTEGTLEYEILKIMQDKDPERAQAALAEYLSRIIEQYVVPEIEEEGPRVIFQPRVSTSQQQIDQNRLDAYVEQYGRLEQGENPARDVAIPRQTPFGRVRRGFRTAVESRHTPERAVPRAINELLHNDALSYQRITDKSAIAFANREMEKKGYDKVRAEWQGKIDSDSEVTKNDLALAELLYIEAVKADDMETAMSTIVEISEAATNAGQVVQAIRMLKNMPASYQLYYFQRVVSRLNRQYAKRINSGRMNELKIDPKLARAVLRAKTQEEVEAAVDALLQNVADQIPSTLADKWNAWRYFSMLGNPKTHIRNVVGNAIFAPAKFMKNLTAAGLESIFIRDTNQRQTSFKGLLSPAAKARYRAFAEEDYQGIKKDLQEGGSKYSPTNDILQRRNLFKSKLLNKAVKGNGNLLEAEDGMFLHKHYVNALVNFLASRNFDLETLESSDKALSREARSTLNAARQYAFNEAQKATYRDASAVASAINQLKRVPGIGLLVEGVLPFAKTPINILKRGIEYSPVGLLQTLATDARKLKAGEITANDFIDHIAAGMTGTGIMVLGMWLSSLGILRGGPDEDDKQEDFDKLQGIQDYSITLPVGDQMVNYTIDWMAPSALPLFVGNAIFREFSTDEQVSLANWINAFTAIAEPITQLSMLSGLNDVFKTGKWDENPLSSVAMAMASGYASQGIPTLLAQIARSTTADRRTTYVDKNSDVPQALQRWFQTNVMGKVPGLNDKRVAYIDPWGRKDTTNSVLLRLVDNMISPGYSNAVKTTALDKELQRLADATGTSVLMTTAERSIEFNNQKHNLTAEQYSTYATVRGQSAYQMLNELVHSAAYAGLSDEEKAKTVGFVKDYANVLGKQAVFPEYDPTTDNWAEKCDGDPNRLVNMAVLKAQANAQGISAGNNGNFYNLIVNSDWLDPIEQGYAIAQQYDTTSKSVYINQRGPKYELTRDRKDQLYSYFRLIFPEYFLQLSSSAAWRNASDERRLEMLSDLRAEVGGVAKGWLAQQLFEAGALPMS